MTDAHASGHGTGWLPDRVYERIDWETGDFFYMPPNINHRHVNKSQDKPAKLLQVEAWPLMIYLGISEMIQQEVAGRAPLTKVGE